MKTLAIALAAVVGLAASASVASAQSSKMSSAKPKIVKSVTTVHKGGRTCR